MSTLKKNWDENEITELWNNIDNFAGNTSSQEIVRLSKKYIGKDVLDVGAGSGALINQITNSVGIDLAPKGKKIIKGSIVNIPFENDRFDTIFATEVLEHLDDKTLEDGLKEIYRVLRKNGYFIITVPYKEKLDCNIVTCPSCKLKFHRYGHLQVFDQNDIAQILEQHKFKIIDLKIIPIGFMANHKKLKYFIWSLKKLGVIKEENIFLIAKKVDLI